VTENTDRNDAPPENEDGYLIPRADGKIYCCVTLGWVTLEEAFDHRWDTSRSPDDFAPSDREALLRRDTTRNEVLGDE
jgi:hypothetical protein